MLQPGRGRVVFWCLVLARAGQRGAFQAIPGLPRSPPAVDDAARVALVATHRSAASVAHDTSRGSIARQQVYRVRERGLWGNLADSLSLDLDTTDNNVHLPTSAAVAVGTSRHALISVRGSNLRNNNNRDVTPTWGYNRQNYL